MDYRQVGKSGLYVSPLMLGTMTFGEADKSSMFHNIGCKKEVAFKILDHAIEQGINCIDTANVYGNDGMVEKLLGEYFCARKNRDGLVLATKFRFTMGEKPHMSGASRKHIMWAVENSLKRLQTNYIDLYQIHMQDIKTPEEETLRALEDLISQGKVRYIGASNYAAYRFLDSLYISKHKNFNKYISMQMQYNMLCRGIEWEHVPLSLKHGVGILAWSPLGGGMLTGKYEPNVQIPGTRFDEKKDWLARYDCKKNWRIINQVKNISRELGVTPTQIALRWLMDKPGVAAAIVGARKLDQIQEIMKVLEIKIPEELKIKLDEISAPEVFYPYSFVGSKQGAW